jgi:hypothetical protein
MADKFKVGGEVEHHLADSASVDGNNVRGLHFASDFLPASVSFDRRKKPFVYSTVDKQYTYTGATLTDGDWLDLDNWAERSGGGGGSGVLERDVTVTRSGSGYPVGTVLEAGTPLTDVIEGDLSPYLTNAITSLTISFIGFSGTAEVGRELTVTQSAYTSSLDSAGDPVQSIKIAGIGFDADIVRTASPVAADLAPFIATRSTAGTLVWTATGVDAKGAAKSRTATQAYQYMHAFGASATVVNDNATAQAVYDILQQKALTAGRARTVTTTADNANASNRTIICYDASFGELSGIIQNGATPVLAAFNNLGAFDIVNQYGVTRSYRFYASDAPGAFVNGTTLAIT